ncbi:MAG TPA: peptidoglycan-binding protein [Gaiellaceae bacterium]|nr:peptidoglycan-binding protein [Gaiellaceae bacterium]
MLVAAAAVAVVLVPSAHAAGGSVNPQIAGLQVALRAWGLYPGPIDGISGPLTAAGLHRFQERHHLPPGVANARTRVALGPLGHPLFGSRLLAKGDFGWDVSVLQFVLTRDHLYHGAYTGYMDASTVKALRRFQRNAKLQVDGIAGTRTLASLAVRARVPVRIVPVAEHFQIYVVRSGDSLTSIARRYGTTVGALARFNHLDANRVLLIGKRLRIPHFSAGVAPSDVRSLLDTWSSREGVDPSLVRALAWMESGYQTTLVSSAGARGVLQMIPSTRKYVERVLLHRRLPNTVDGNIEAGVVLIKHLLGVFNGDENLALAAWYQGEKAVRTRGVYSVTKPFVADVLALRARM